MRTSVLLLLLLSCLCVADALYAGTTTSTTAMRLRGGKPTGIVGGIANVQKISMGLVGAQGSLMFFAPDKVPKTYGATEAWKEDPALIEVLFHINGAIRLCAVVIMFSIYKGEPLLKAVSFGALFLAIFAAKFGYIDCPKIKQDAAPLYAWAIIQACIGHLLYHGIGDDKLIIKIWVGLLVAVSLPFFLAPEQFFKIFKVKAGGAASNETLKLACTGTMCLAAYVAGSLFPKNQPAAALAGFWTVMGLNLLKMIVDQTYKVLKMKNAYPFVAWAIMSAVLAFESYASA